MIHMAPMARPASMSLKSNRCSFQCPGSTMSSVPSHLLYSLSVSVEELVTLALVSPCQVMMATTPLAMNMKVPIKFQIG